MSFSLLGDNASGGQKAGKKKRRKRNRKKKTKTSSNNNGSEAKKTAPTATSAPAAAPSGASKLGAIVDVVSKIHKNFGKDKIASVAAKLAKKGKGVHAKDNVCEIDSVLF